MTTVAGPKLSKPTLEATANTIAIQQGSGFDYYKVKLGDRRGPFVDIYGLPPDPVTGYVTYNGNLYRLEISDYLRGRVNVSTQYRNSDNGGTTTTTTSSVDSNTLPEPAKPAVLGGNKPGTSDALETQERQDADLAWTRQTEALLAIIDQEEEWDLSALAQSGLLNADCPI